MSLEFSLILLAIVGIFLVGLWTTLKALVRWIVIPTVPAFKAGLDRHLRQVQALEQLARRFAVPYSPPDYFSLFSRPNRLRGPIHGLRLQVDCIEQRYSYRDPLVHLQIRIAPSRGQLSEDLEIRYLPRTPGLKVLAAFNVVLDAPDGTFSLQATGHKGPVFMSLFDPVTRAQLLELFGIWRDSATLSTTGVMIRTTGSPELPARLGETLELLSHLLPRLQAPPTMPDEQQAERLKQILLHDLEVPTRLKSLGAYIKLGPPDIPDILKGLLADPSPEMRLGAARIWMGPESIPVLLEIVERAPIKLAEEAVEVLGARGARDAGPALRHAAHRFGSLEKIAPALAALGDLEAVPLLLSRLDRASESSEVAAIARALRQLKEPQASGALVRIFSRGLLNDDARLELVRALEICGDRDAVAVLYPLTRQTPGSKLRSEARQAIAAIQSRLGPAERGMLTLSEGSSGGALSLAADERVGRLSAADTSSQGSLSLATADHAGALSPAGTSSQGSLSLTASGLTGALSPALDSQAGALSPAGTGRGSLSIEVANPVPDTYNAEPERPEEAPVSQAVAHAVKGPST